MQDPGLLTCPHFRIQKDGSLKVYIENVSIASYESSQYCVSFTDLPHLQEEEEGLMEGNSTAMIVMEDPDLIEDCSDIFTNRTSTTYLLTPKLLRQDFRRI